MDHVFLPSRARLQPFKFPLLCDPTYKRGNWQSYPEENGYQITGEISGDFQIFKLIDQGRRQDISEDGEAVAALFQRWLWFGILLEFLEMVVDADEFVRTGSDGLKWLTTTRLQEYSQLWIASTLNETWTVDVDTVLEWATHRWRMIRRARTLVMRYHQTYDCSHDGIESMTILAIALLCEHLHEALIRIYDRANAGEGWDIIPKFNWRDEDADCAMAVVEKLTTGGWCPRTLAGMGIYASKIETLWFYANLEAPKSALEHGSCTAELCVHQQYDQKTYRTKHMKPDCKCSLIGPDPMALANVVMDGKLPLTRVTFGAGGQIEKVDVQSREEDTKFVAISHIWADGHGNPDGNLLPSCFLQNLQAAVDGIAGAESVAFWMDTLCIPREPPHVRNQALKILRDPYEYAAHVFVLDAYLQSQKSQDCSMIELLAMINVSSWAQRLWTFQEGRLAKDLQLQFADSIICMSHGGIACDMIRSEVISEVPPDILAFHSSTPFTSDFWNISGLNFTSINAIREGLRLRSTSVASDEPLCLGSVMGLDLEEILNQPEAQRMDAFWRMVPSVPASLGLSKASLKLERKGLRWAPASLMGDIEHNEWDGPTSMLGEVAKLSSDGLVCQLAALKFPSQTLPVFAESLKALYSIARDEDHEVHSVCHAIMLRTHEGEWLACQFEEAWHQTPANIIDGESPAILLEAPTNLLDSTRPSESLAGENIAALFVSYAPSLEGVNRKQAHGVRHCSLYYVSQKQCAFMEELDTVSHQLLNEHWDAFIATQGDWDEIYSLLKPLVSESVLNGPCLRIGREAVATLRGTDEFEDQAVLDNAIGTVALFCYIGPNRYAEYESRRETWVID